MSSKVQIIIHAPGDVKEYEVKIFKHTESGDYDALSSFELKINKSGKSNSTIYTISTDLASGRYGAHFFDKKLQKECGAIGFVVNQKYPFHDLSNEIDDIELLYLFNKSRRFVSNGIGKSGTSWILNILGILPGLEIYSKQDQIQSDQENQIQSDQENQIQSDQENQIQSEIESITEMPPGCIYHGHFEFSAMNTLAEQDISVINITRDLRDILVSEYFHKFHFQKGMWRPDLEHLPVNILLSWDLIRTWSSTMYRAYDAILWDKFLHKSSCRYEDMLLDTYGEVQRIFSGINLNVPPNLLRYAVEACDFEVYSNGRGRGNADPDSFFRSGTNGDWKRFLTDETSNKIVDHFEYFFRHFDYQICDSQ